MSRISKAALLAVSVAAAASLAACSQSGLSDEDAVARLEAAFSLDAGSLTLEDERERAASMCDTFKDVTAADLPPDGMDALLASFGDRTALGTVEAAAQMGQVIAIQLDWQCPQQAGKWRDALEKWASVYGG